MTLSCDRVAKEESFLEARNLYMNGEIGIAQAHDMENGAHKRQEKVKNITLKEVKCSCGLHIECIDITRHYSFNIGSAMKYIWDCEQKGSTLEDIRKAIWHLEDELKQRQKL